MDGDPELGGEGSVEEPEGDVEEVVGAASEEQSCRKDTSVVAVKHTRVRVETVAHESKADGDENRGKMNREGKAKLLQGATAGQVAEHVGKKG